MVAPNGATRGKADHPAIPLTTQEIAETAVSCRDAGADALHLHVRDDSGRHSLDAGRYREALAALRDVLPDLPIQVSTEAAGLFDVSDQLALLADLKPRWVSLSVREITRDPDLIARTYATCADNGTAVQHILYDADDARALGNLQAKGLVQEDASVILVLGRYAATINSEPGDLEPFIASLPPVGSWMVCAFGRSEHRTLRAAATLGGDVRVGFENSIYREDGTLWEDVAASVSSLRTSLNGLN